MSNLYIHIGPPKTATTSLQHFLQNYDSCLLEYAGINQPRNQRKESLGKELYRKVTNQELNGLDKSALYKQLNEASKNAKKKTVISEEMFVVHSERISWKEKITNLLNFLEGIDFTILYSVREPASAIRSYYQELFENLDISQYDNINSFALSDYCSIYDYSRFLDSLESLGCDNVLLLDYNKFISNEYSLNEIFEIEDSNKIDLPSKNKSRM